MNRNVTVPVGSSGIGELREDPVELAECIRRGLVEGHGRTAGNRCVVRVGAEGSFRFVAAALETLRVTVEPDVGHAPSRDDAYDDASRFGLTDRAEDVDNGVQRARDHAPVTGVVFSSDPFARATRAQAVSHHVARVDQR